MRRTVRALMEGTMPSLTAWRARSALDQCVRCTPAATGSKYASWLIWACWRGGKLARSAHSARSLQQTCQPLPFITAAGSPHGVFVTLHLPGHRLGPLASGDPQDNPCPSDLEPRQRLTPRHLLEDGPVGRADGDGVRLASAHGRPPRREWVGTFSIADAPQDREANFPYYFLPGSLGIETTTRPRSE